ncbi:MAG: DUF1269 domain-containing protein [Acidimicrobiia bacterium]
MENVILLTVEEPSRAYQALSELQRLSEAGAVHLRGAAIIQRGEDGRWTVPEETEESSYTGLLTGGAIGALVGALLGPVGLLLGGVTGMLVGTASDLEGSGQIDLLLSRFPRRVPPGSTALVADVDEPATEVVDAVAAKLGTVERMPRTQVEEEIAAAEVAANQAEDEAKRAERAQRKAAGEETLGDRFADLRDKLSGRNPPPANL